MDRIYFDHHATTPTDPRVVEAMLPWFTERPGNPSSPHAFGWEAAEAVQASQDAVAALLGVDAREIVFTSGATESNNLAIHGVAERPGPPGHVVTSQIEHPSILNPLTALERRGVEATRVGVDSAGRVDVKAVVAAFRPDTTLCTIMTANGEVGTLQPTAEIAVACRERGIVFHTDATQAVGKIDLRAVGPDLLSLSGHKFHGPKGVGALVVSRRRPRVRLVPQMQGGAQQWGTRPGTVPVPLVVGLAEACRIAGDELESEAARVGQLRDRLRTRLLAVEGATENGDPTHRLPGNLSVSFLGCEAQALLLELKDIAFSSGSACTADQHEPSHVLLAMGVDPERAHSTVRFGLGRFSTSQEVDQVATRVTDAVTRLRERTPHSLAGPAGSSQESNG